MAKRNKSPAEIEQEEYLVNVAELEEELDLDVLKDGENAGSSSDENEPGQNAITDAEVSGFETPDRQTPSKVEKEEKKAEAEDSAIDTRTEEAKEVEKKEAEIETKSEEKPAAQETPPAEKTQETIETPPSTPESYTPEEITKVYKDWRETTENLLADHHYALKPEELEEFEVEPNKVISRLMARVYLDSVTAAINQVTNSFPRLVSLTLEQNERDKESENVFFNRWPQLKGQDELVRRLGANYRAQNPTASAEQFINEIGAAAMVALRLDPHSQSGNGTQAQQPTPPAQKSFVPATSTPTPTPAKQINKNVFTQLADEFEQEDADFA